MVQEMKKIALITQWHPLSGGGKYAFDLFKRFKKKYDTRMIYFEYGSNKILYGKEDKVIKIKKSILNFLDKTLMTYYYFPKHIPNGYDLYHATNQYLARVAKYKKPCIITHMDITPILFPKGKFAPIGFFLKRLLKHYKEAEHIIALSEVVKNELLQQINIPDEKVTAVYPGFDEKNYRPFKKHTAREALNLPLDKKIILNVGSEEPHKGVPFLLECIAKLKKKNKNILLVRIGSSNPKYDTIKKELGILQLKGIPEDKMPLYYSSADVFAAPLNYSEGFVYPPLEAIACGTPALVSNLQFPGYVNVPLETFFSMLQNILDDKKFRERLISKGLEKAKKFTLTKEVEKINNIYKMVLK